MNTYTCSICLGNVIDPIKSPCEHIYCNSCLTGWLLKKNTCPVCRKNIGCDRESYVTIENDNIDEEEHLIQTITGHILFSSDHIIRCNPHIREYFKSVIERLINYVIYEYEEENGNSEHNFVQKEIKKNKMFILYCRFVIKNRTLYISVNVDIRVLNNYRSPKNNWIYRNKCIKLKKAIFVYR